MKNIKLIVLLSQPINAHIEKRLNLNLLLNRGFSLHILDLSAFMMPNYPSVDFRLNESQNLTITKISNKRCLKLFLEKSSRKCVAIDASNQNPWIRHQLNRNGIPVIRYLSGGLPVSPPSVDGNFYLRSTLLKKVLIKLKRLEIRGLTKVFCNFFYKKYYFSSYKPYLDVLILGGERLRSNEAHYINENTLIIESHVPDLEDFTRFQDTDARELPKKYLVFLDQHIPYHPDFAMRNSQYSSPSVYFSRIRGFFEIVENLGFEVIIALHPRAEESTNFGDRKCYKNRTASLVANSSGVISHFSNSINFAVLNFKPIIFIADAELLEMNFQIEILSAWLNKPILRLENKPDPVVVHNQLVVAKNEYKTYKKNFIECEADAGATVIDLLTKQVSRLSSNLR